MKRFSPALVVVLAACGSGGSPESAFNEWKKAWVSQDWNKLYETIPPSMRMKRQEQWKRSLQAIAANQDGPEARMATAVSQASVEEVLAMDDRAFFVRTMQEMQKRADAGTFQKMDAITLVSVTGDGDKRTLKVSNQGFESQMQAVKENGAWYIDSPFEGR